MDQSVSSASHIYVDTLLVCTDPMPLILLAVIIRCTLGIMATRCRVFSACSLSTVLASCTLEPPALGNIALDSCSLTTIRSAGLACFLHLAAPGLALLLKPHFVLDPRILDVLPSALEYTESVRSSFLKVLLLFLSECLMFDPRIPDVILLAQMNNNEYGFFTGYGHDIAAENLGEHAEEGPVQA